MYIFFRFSVYGQSVRKLYLIVTNLKKLDRNDFFLFVIKE